MKDVLKTAYTLWCLLLLVVFILAACVSFLAMIYGLSTDQDGLMYAGALCVFTFGWGAGRYSKIFTDRVAQTKESAIDWNDKDDDESDYND